VSAPITIRELASQEDYAACVALQYETWGSGFRDAVPASILLIAQKLGGVAAGAFDADGRLLGFVFGITGVEEAAIVHWSDMLAVRPEARGTGIARQLKQYQRERVAAAGGDVIYWTYDPLVARNAHLNFNVFGVRVKRYVRDMYGSNTGSDLHRGIGTDRLIVAWSTDDAELAGRRRETSTARESRELLTAPILGEPDQRALRAPDGRRARIAVPADLLRLQQEAPGEAARWRSSTRAAFEQTLAEGFEVIAFHTDLAAGRGFYLLSRS
jgi:chorismate synthase